MSGGKARRQFARRLAPWALGLLVAAPVGAQQSGGFVTVLGRDTVQVERFVRQANRAEGTVVTRAPRTRIVRYALLMDATGHPTEYRVQSFDANGTPIQTNAAAGSLRYAGDSLVRETLVDGALATQRFATPPGTVPGPMLPYLGVSNLMYEIGLGEARRQAAGAAEGTFPSVTMLAQQTRPQQARLWFVGPDSVEMDYFGVARSGWKFSPAGELLRADWTATTYRYRITRIAAPDVEAIARAWGEADAAGQGMGAMSPLDSLEATVGAGRVSITYSRPAARGRAVWGGLVPWGRVWRFGADMATHLTLSTAMTIGGEQIPAGTYTLWMVPMENEPSLLVINTRTRIFGTMYTLDSDLVRIPLERSTPAAPSERFTLAVANGRFWIRWADGEWSVPVAVP